MWQAVGVRSPPDQTRCRGDVQSAMSSTTTSPHSNLAVEREFDRAAFLGAGSVPASANLAPAACRPRRTWRRQRAGLGEPGAGSVPVSIPRCGQRAGPPISSPRLTSRRRCILVQRHASRNPVRGRWEVNGTAYLARYPFRTACEVVRPLANAWRTASEARSARSPGRVASNTGQTGGSDGVARPSGRADCSAETAAAHARHRR
jgi:hypothetical protein